MPNTAISKKENQQPVAERMAQGHFFTPLVDIVENENEFVFQADLPGVKSGDVDISYENGVLTIDGRPQQRQPAGHNYLWQEYGVGRFYRQFTLDTPVNVDAIRAELKDGELTLHVPKAEHARTRKIQIKSD